MNESRVALKFKLSEIPEDVTQATLSLYLIGPIFPNPIWSQSGTLEIHKLTHEWTEDTATWDNLADQHDKNIEDSKEYISKTTDMWFDFDVTDAILGAPADGEANFMLTIDTYIDDYDGGSVLKFASSEYEDVSYRPKLYIE